jgi:hypothetical protein
MFWQLVLRGKNCFGRWIRSIGISVFFVTVTYRFLHSVMFMWYSKVIPVSIYGEGVELGALAR